MCIIAHFLLGRLEKSINCLHSQSPDLFDLFMFSFNIHRSSISYGETVYFACICTKQAIELNCESEEL